MVGSSIDINWTSDDLSSLLVRIWFVLGSSLSVLGLVFVRAL